MFLREAAATHGAQDRARQQRRMERRSDVATWLVCRAKVTLGISGVCAASAAACSSLVRIYTRVHALRSERHPHLQAVLGIQVLAGLACGSNSSLLCACVLVCMCASTCM